MPQNAPYPWESEEEFRIRMILQSGGTARPSPPSPLLPQQQNVMAGFPQIPFSMPRVSPPTLQQNLQSRIPQIMDIGRQFTPTPLAPNWRQSIGAALAAQPDYSGVYGAGESLAAGLRAGLSGALGLRNQYEKQMQALPQEQFKTGANIYSLMQKINDAEQDEEDRQQTRRTLNELLTRRGTSTTRQSMTVGPSGVSITLPAEPSERALQRVTGTITLPTGDKQRVYGLFDPNSAMYYKIRTNPSAPLVPYGPEFTPLEPVSQESLKEQWVALQSQIRNTPEGPARTALLQQATDLESAIKMGAPQILSGTTPTGEPRFFSVARESGQVTPVEGVLPKPDSAVVAMQDARKSVSAAIPILKGLSARLITTTGPSQRLRSLYRSGAAALGADPEFRSYQDATAALTLPLAALLNRGRPTDRDYTSASRLLPNPFRDTAETLPMKWAIFEAAMQVENPEQIVIRNPQTGALGVFTGTDEEAQQAGYEIVR